MTGAFGADLSLTFTLRNIYTDFHGSSLTDIISISYFYYVLVLFLEATFNKTFLQHAKIKKTSILHPNKLPTGNLHNLQLKS